MQSGGARRLFRRAWAWRSRARARIAQRGAALILSAAGVCGCNLVALQEAKLAEQMSEVGLVQALASVGDARVQYWTGGRGTPVLFLHGFGGDARWQWSTQAQDLVAGHAVLAPDLLWFGGSVSTRAAYSVAYQAEVIAAWLAELQVDRVDVVGSSYGGFVALALAERCPDRVARMVLVDSPGPQFDAAAIAALTRRVEASSLEDFLVPRTASKMRRLLDASYADPPFTPSFVLHDIVETLYLPHVAEKRALIRQLPSDLERMGRHLSPARSPTLVLWGRDDAIFPLRLGEELTERLGPNAHFEVIDEAGHVPNLERPEAFNRSLRAFLELPRPAPMPRRRETPARPPPTDL